MLVYHLCAVVFGISDEIHQWFVPNRQADIWDLLADTLGATLLYFDMGLHYKKILLTPNSSGLEYSFNDCLPVRERPLSRL